MWDHNHEIIRAEWKYTLAYDCTSFELRQMTTGTNQLISIAKATGSRIYTRESEVGAQGSAKALVLSLKQFHAHYDRPYEKGTNRVMVGLQGLYSSNTFWHLNVLASVGPKSFFPWCLQFRGNTEFIATHLKEVHYRLATACDICWSFASMFVQVVLEHWLKCRANSHEKSKFRK